MKHICTCLLVFLFLLSGCGKLKEKYCYVVCDFSASQDSISLRQIIANADSVFVRCLQNGFNVRYFDISPAPYRRSFFEYTISSAPVTPSELEEEEKEIYRLRDSLHVMMDTLQKEFSGQTTCILSTLEKVAGAIVLDAKPDIDPVIRVIILSDMMEDCLYPSGKIDIDGANLDTAINRVTRMPTPKSLFSDPRIRIDLVASSQSKLDHGKMTEFWGEVLKKFGYNKKFTISPMMPDIN